MTIVVNGEVCDITLEKENNAGQVYDGINQWLTNEGLVISELILDSNEIDLNEQKWRSSDINAIQKMEFVAYTIFTLHVKKLELVKEYLLHLRDFLKNKLSADEIRQFLSDYAYINQLIHETMPGLGSSTLQLTNLLNESGLIAKGTCSEEILPAVFSATEGLILVCQEHIQEIRMPEKVLLGTIDALKPFIDDPGQVSILLQNGKDSAAMQKMIQISDLLQKLYRLHTIITTEGIETDEAINAPLNEVVEKLSPQLQELEEAFKNEDYVLIGDLLEYEVAPVLEILLQ